MPKFKPYRKNQFMLFPKSINDYVPENHLSRMIDSIVEQLNTKDIEDKYSSLGQNRALGSELAMTHFLSMLACCLTNVSL